MLNHTADSEKPKILVVDDTPTNLSILEEILEEAHLSPDYILEGVERFVREREERMERICQGVEEARSR